VEYFPEAHNMQDDVFAEVIFLKTDLLKMAFSVSEPLFIGIFWGKWPRQRQYWLMQDDEQSTAFQVEDSDAERRWYRKTSATYFTERQLPLKAFSTKDFIARMNL